MHTSFKDLIRGQLFFSHTLTVGDVEGAKVAVGEVGAGEIGATLLGLREGLLVLIIVGREVRGRVEGDRVGLEEGREVGNRVGKKVGGRGGPSAQQNTPAFCSRRGKQRGAELVLVTAIA
jgi:hypothetical protein